MSEKFAEQEVDEELTSYLEKQIPKKTRTFSEAFQEEETVEEDPEDTQPCTKETRDAIYNLWSQTWDEKGEKLLPLVQKIQGMSESQAKAYLQCLKAVHSRSVHKHLSDRILYILSHVVCHPLDIQTPIAIQEDEYLKTGVSLLCSDFLSYIGRMGSILLLFAYAGASRYTHRSTPSSAREIVKGCHHPTHTSHTPLPSNGMFPGSDGENNINDKVND